MKTITILIPEGGVLSAISGTRYMFTAVNNFFKSAGKPVPFKIQLAGLQKEVHLEKGTFTINTDCLLEGTGLSDLIIIPALSGDMKKAVAENARFIPWLINQYKNGAEIASLCVGAFLLATTGLLKNKQCSTHWLYANEFRDMFPEIELVDEKILTDQNGLYSSGGANCFWNLLLYLVEKYTNREIAIAAAKYFALDFGRNCQSTFVIFSGQKTHGDEAVFKAQDYIEQNFTKKIAVEELAALSGLGRRTFERRFKKVTYNSVVEYIQRVKIEAAKKELEAGRKTVSEVMYDVGYSDTKAFRDIFRRISGMTPIDYRKYYRSGTTNIN